MPYSRNFIRPFSDNQSVVHAGDNWRLSSNFSMPLSRSAFSISKLIIEVAGQPEYVGVIVTIKVSSCHSTFRITPRSGSEITGISGSGTDSSHRQIWSSVGFSAFIFIALTTLHPGKRVVRIAYLKGCIPDARSVCRISHLFE